VHENQFQFIIECELPGVEEDDISISIYNGQLFIKGHKHSEREEKKDNLYISERSFGSFERRLHLPENIDIEKIEAKFDKGILNIIFQKNSNLVRNEIRIPINR
jgi:HSP20 family protein